MLQQSLDYCRIKSLRVGPQTHASPFSSPLFSHLVLALDTGTFLVLAGTELSLALKACEHATLRANSKSSDLAPNLLVVTYKKLT